MDQNDGFASELFADLPNPEKQRESLAEGAVLLRNFCTTEAPVLMASLDEIIASAPFRHMITPGGYRMSVAMTNCGSLGWVSDRTGYRYDSVDPVSGTLWPAMPD